MPHKIVAVDNAASVVGASYYNDRGFLSALAVLPDYRGRGVGRLLIAATLGDMQRRLGCMSSSLHVLGCDAGTERHGLYTSCGYSGGDPTRGGDYTMQCIADGVEEAVMAAGRGL